MLVDCQKLVILDTDFGFLGLVFQASKVLHLSLGHTSPSHVRRAIADYPNLDGSASVCREADLQNRAISHLVGQLHRYTEGEEQEFRGVHLDLTGQSPFARRVTAACRKIPYGQTAAYGTLARRAGSPRGARGAECGNSDGKKLFPVAGALPSGGNCWQLPWWFFGRWRGGAQTATARDGSGRKGKRRCGWSLATHPQKSIRSSNGNFLPCRVSSRSDR